MLDAREVLHDLLNEALYMKKNGADEVLTGKILAMIFEKSSTRTRVSFEVGMRKLGGYALFLGKNDIQLGRGETIEDTAIVLSRYVDCIMYRAYRHSDMKELAAHTTVPVINGLDDQEHPCQVIADLMTIKEFKGVLKGLHAVYFGDGNNNVAHSLLLGCPMVGIDIKVVSPKKYWPSPHYIDKAREIGNVEITELEKNTADDADVIITDTWISMGDEAEKEIRQKEFKGYIVDENLMKQAKPDAIFLHCLPAYYGKEVEKEIAHGDQSVIFDEAENRMWAQMAILKWLLAF